jgi:hypothetical protein
LPTRQAATTAAAFGGKTDIDLMPYLIAGIAARGSADIP